MPAYTSHDLPPRLPLDPITKVEVEGSGGGGAHEAAAGAEARRRRGSSFQYSRALREARSAVLSGKLAPYIGMKAAPPPSPAPSPSLLGPEEAHVSLVPRMVLCPRTLPQGFSRRQREARGVPRCNGPSCRIFPHAVAEVPAPLVRGRRREAALHRQVACGGLCRGGGGGGEVTCGLGMDWRGVNNMNAFALLLS